MRSTFEGEIEINGARLQVMDMGQGSPVVLVHSGITDSRMWDDQLETFAARHRVMTHDLRGFGRSTIPPSEFAHHEDLRDLLDACNVESATLVGASFGGDVVLAFAVEYPERVDALVLVNTLAGMTEPSPELRSGWRAVDAALASGSVDDAVEIELRTWVDGPHRIPGQVEPEVRERVREMDAALLRRADEQEAATETDPEPPDLERLGTIAAPVLVVVGSLDLPDALASADVLVAAIPGATRLDIESAAHLPTMERPEIFNPAVLAFIESLPAPT